MSDPSQIITATLSPLDQLFTGSYSRFLLIFEAGNHELAVQTLHDGLWTLTTAVPFLKGRVATRTGTQRNQATVSWAADDAAPTLHRIEAPSGFPSMAVLKAEQAALSYFTEAVCAVPYRVDPTIPGPQPEPVFVGSYTPIEGGLLLCACFHHTVMDGTAVGLFLKLWAESCKADAGVAPRSPTALPHPDEPLVRRDVLLAACGPGAVKVAEGKTMAELAARESSYIVLSLQPPQSQEGPGIPLALPRSPHTKVLSLSGAKLQAAQARLQKVSGSSGLSTNNILTAILWSTFVYVKVRHGRGADGATASTLHLAVDGRRRLGGALLERPYLGNVNCTTTVDLPLTLLEAACEVAQMGPHATEGHDPSALLAVIAALVGGINGVTGPRVAERIALVDALEDLRDVRFDWNPTVRTDFCFTSLANFPVYESDFGPALGAAGRPGTPAFMRFPDTYYPENMAMILPRKRAVPGASASSASPSDERMEVLVPLVEEEWNHFEKLLDVWLWSSNPSWQSLGARRQRNASRI